MLASSFFLHIDLQVAGARDANITRFCSEVSCADAPGSTDGCFSLCETFPWALDLTWSPKTPKSAYSLMDGGKRRLFPEPLTSLSKLFANYLSPPGRRIPKTSASTLPERRKSQPHAARAANTKVEVGNIDFFLRRTGHRNPPTLTASMVGIVNVHDHIAFVVPAPVPTVLSSNDQLIATYLRFNFLQDVSRGPPIQPSAGYPAFR